MLTFSCCVDIERPLVLTRACGVFTPLRHADNDRASLSSLAPAHACCCTIAAWSSQEYHKHDQRKKRDLPLYIYVLAGPPSVDQAVGETC